MWKIQKMNKKQSHKKSGAQNRAGKKEKDKILESLLRKQHFFK